MTDQDAFDEWFAKRDVWPRITYDEVWHAALAWLRSQAEPVAWLFDGRKPGQHRQFASVDSSDSQTWPIDDGIIWEKYPLYAAPQPTIPDGWQLVPMEPTEEMLRSAFCEAGGSYENTKGIYRAMLATTPEPAVPDGRQSDAERDVLAERRRQVEAEGWTPEHDDAHGDGSMCMAAVCYAEWDHYERPNSDGLIPINWPWSAKWWKPRDRRRNLVKAAALLLAEIERLDRTSTAAPKPGEST